MKRFIVACAAVMGSVLLALGGGLSASAVTTTFEITYTTPDAGTAGGLVPSASPYGIVAGSGTYAWVVNLDPQTISTLDISNPLAPTVVATTPDPDSPGGLPSGGFPTEIFKSGNYLFTILNNIPSVKVIDVANPTSPTVVASTPDPGTAGGFASGSGPINAVMNGNYIYVLNVGNSSISTVDISNPLAPIVLGSTEDAGTPGGLPSSAGAWGIARSGDYLLVSSSGTSKLFVVDVSNPAAPAVVGSTPDADTAGGFIGGGNVRDVVVKGSHAYIADYNNNVVYSVDISTPTSPTVVGQTPAPGLEGSFDGGAAPRGMIVVDDTLVVTREGDVRVSLIDIREPAAPMVYQTTPTSGSPGGLPAGAVPQRLYLIGNAIYISNYAHNSVSVISLASVRDLTAEMFPVELSDGETDNDSGSLANTGTDAVPLLSVGVGLLFVGLAALGGGFTAARAKSRQ